ncbi:hypothetical protein VTK73DRAFT_10311 [Phialemonium thermophilum]|uniref:Uncharacterized protein n=1 Tax=Phialemonium thermophilum TaxID=223376 RepID=A0ABR3XGT7_9PEZI
MRAGYFSLFFASQLPGSALGASTLLRRQAAELTATATEARVTAVSDCSLSGTIQYCSAGTTSFQVSNADAATTGLASSYTGCHNHGTQTWCIAPDGEEVQLLPGNHVATATSASVTSPPASSTSVTAVSECHMHGSSVYCLAGETEYFVDTTVTATSELPPMFTGCHSHGSETYCLDPTGEDVQITLEGEEESAGGEEPSGKHCHFHAGVEHCVGGDSSEGESSPSCERVDRDYNIPLRIGLLFVILATSAIGVFGPILVTVFVPPQNIGFAILKQFGTGVVISTAFVHLQTHSTLMFENDCVGELAFEGTAAAIMMAGIFVSFLVEYAGNRLLAWHAAKKVAESVEESSSAPAAARTAQTVHIMVLEAGIIFHSLIIGVTLVVAGDSFFLTLFAVIIFHQMFEGIALGSRIAAAGLPGESPSLTHIHGGATAHPNPSSTAGPVDSRGNTDTKEGSAATAGALSMRKKLLLATAFALVTPIGMAIGIGVIKQFNGNDPATAIAIGTLDAFSAGILVWVGVVEMLAQDWMLGGDMSNASPVRTALGLAALVAGMALMSFLGKWA